MTEQQAAGEGLRRRFLAMQNFELAWDKVAANAGCSGVDGETVAAFGYAKEQVLPRLRHAVERGTYRPLPLQLDQELVPWIVRSGISFAKAVTQQRLSASIQGSPYS